VIRQFDINGKLHTHPSSIVKTVIDGRKAFKIHGGECAVVYEKDNVAVSTLLGSCVAVMLYDKVKKVLGMNHFLIPSSISGDDSMKYGLFSMELLINDMLKQGCAKKNMTAKISGGAKVVSSLGTTVGSRNIEFARDFCLKEEIPIISEDVGGERGRVIFMDKGFETFVRYIEHDHGIEEIEKADVERLSQKVAEKKKQQDVFFFD
jgi:chemotaxis protein CheD